MRVAMTVWGDRVSPVLDCARNLLRAEIAGGEVVGRKSECFDAGLLPVTLRELRRQGVQVLICGAVSQDLATVIESCDVRLIPLLPATWRKFLKPLPREGRYRPSPCQGVDCGAARELDVDCRRNPSGPERWHVVLMSQDNRRMEYAGIES